MRDYVCACSASFIEDSPLVDINFIEESSGAPELIVATLPRSDQMVFTEMNGRLHEDNLSKVLDIATRGCKDVFTILDRAARDHISQVSAALCLETWILTSFKYKS